MDRGRSTQVTFLLHSEDPKNEKNKKKSVLYRCKYYL